ncbi:DUF742 domain-containing protein [Streptomyces sp. NPDC020883]|uniref:DUF742 domain-containing protein n=1 Tax=Streptomyces sp. NPDC020883 TaxID=3365099 RepID=UPI0037A39B76
MSTGGGPFGTPGEDQGPEDDQTFADVLNAFSWGNARRRRKRSEPGDRPEAAPAQEADRPPTHPSPGSPEAAPPADPLSAWTPEYQHQDTDQYAASIVRAYTWTGGRTRSNHHFEIETLVTATELGYRSTAIAQTEYRAVIGLCGQPVSVAEVAALLTIPLGVAKVLLGDMAECGLITVHQTATTNGDPTPDCVLMERVLSGLRRL